MDVYKTTREHLASVAVAARDWANLNAESFMKGPLTIGDVLASRMVSTPLTVRDCCLVTDGGAAVVEMVAAHRAKDFPKAPVYLLGAAAATSHLNIMAMPDVTVTAAADFGKAGLRHGGHVARGRRCGGTL